MAIEDRELLRFDTIADFRAWLERHQDDTPGVRLVIAKKGAPFTTHTVDESLDAALEYGWIDGRRKGIDEHSYEQYYTPRTATSMWSMKNVETVTRKIEAGEIKPRGLLEIENANADGRWDRAYGGSTAATPHPEFLAALEQNPAAKSTYESLNAQNRFAVYFRLHNVKRDETRTRLVGQFIDKLAAGEKFY